MKYVTKKNILKGNFVMTIKRERLDSRRKQYIKNTLNNPG